MYDFFTRNNAEKMFTFLTKSKKFAKTKILFQKVSQFHRNLAINTPLNNKNR